MGRRSIRVYSESSHLGGLMPLRFCACSLQGEGAESRKSGKKVREKQDLKGFKKIRYIAS